MATYFQAIYTPALGASGEVLSGAKWYFYLTGTTTLATIYSSSSLSTALTNPVIADSAGRFANVFLDDSVTYRAVLKTSAGATVRDVDPINGANSNYVTDAELAVQVALLQDEIDTVEEAIAPDVAAAAASAAEAAAAALAAEATLADVATAAETIDAIYASTAAGIAATVDGEYFFVAGTANTNTWAKLYRNDAEVATFLNDLPSLISLTEAVAAVEARLPTSPMLPGGTISDSNGYAVAAFGANFSHFYGSDAMKTGAAAGTAAGLLVTQRKSPPMNTIGDGDGYAISATTPYSIVHPTITKLKQAEGRAKLNALFRESSMLAMWIIGQSLSVGLRSIPQISTTPLDFAYSYVGGPRPFDTTTVYATALASIVPYYERFTDSGDNDLGETVGAGILLALRSLFRKHYDLDIVDTAAAFLLGAPGADGTSAQSIYEDADGGFARSQQLTNYAVATSAAVDRRFGGCVAMPYIQGEQDYILDTDADTWWGYVEDIRAGVEAQNETALGEQVACVGYSYQISTHLACGRTDPTLAIKQLRMENSGTWGLVSPTHMLAYFDTLHLTNKSSAKLGAMIGYQIFYRQIERQVGVGRRFGTAVRDGNDITIPTFNVGAARGTMLVEDTSAGSAADFGFTLIDVNGDDVTISASQIDGENVILTDDGTATGWRYGWTGSSNHGVGTLRDDDPSTLPLQDGTLLRLFNWPPIDEGDIT